MTKRMDWSRAREKDKARADHSVPTFYATPPKAGIPFAQVYARYANRKRVKGEKPLPPKQFIDALKANKPV